MAEAARHVRIDPVSLGRCAETLSPDEVRSVAGPALPEIGHDPEGRCAFILCLDAVNFGSGYFPHLRKQTGKSGYRTLEAGLLRHFETHGPLSAAELEGMTAARCAALFGQGLDSLPVVELMQYFAVAWRDLGQLLSRSFAGRFATLVEAAEHSSATLIRMLLAMPLYRDLATYDYRTVPFLKRAQLTVADLASALPGELGHFADLDELTLFADNLVPHVLRLDGVLDFDRALVARIEAGALIPAGSPEEVEIRACALHAVELLARQLQARGSPLTPRELDYWLWSRGALPRYKARPRHRTRCCFY